MFFRFHLCVPVFLFHSFFQLSTIFRVLLSSRSLAFAVPFFSPQQSCTRKLPCAHMHSAYISHFLSPFLPIILHCVFASLSLLQIHINISYQSSDITAVTAYAYNYSYDGPAGAAYLTRSNYAARTTYIATLDKKGRMTIIYPSTTTVDPVTQVGRLSLSVRTNCSATLCFSALTVAVSVSVYHPVCLCMPPCRTFSC